MLKLKDLLKKLIGRIKENMDAFYFGTTTLLFSAFIALFVLLVGTNYLNYSNKAGMLILCIILLFASIVSWIKAYHVARAKDNLMLSKFTVETTGEKSTVTELKSINENIKTLIHEIRKDRNKN